MGKHTVVKAIILIYFIVFFVVFTISTHHRYNVLKWSHCTVGATKATIFVTRYSSFVDPPVQLLWNESYAYVIVGLGKTPSTKPVVKARWFFLTRVQLFSSITQSKYSHDFSSICCILFLYVKYASSPSKNLFDFYIVQTKCTMPSVSIILWAKFS